MGSAICDWATAGDAIRATEIFVDYWSGTGAWSALSERHQSNLARRTPAVTSNFDTLFAEKTTIDAYRGLTIPTLLLVGAHDDAHSQNRELACRRDAARNVARTHRDGPHGSCYARRRSQCADPIVRLDAQRSPIGIRLELANPHSRSTVAE